MLRRDVGLSLVVCRVLCAKVVGATSSEGFLFQDKQLHALQNSINVQTLDLQTCNLYTAKQHMKAKISHTLRFFLKFLKFTSWQFQITTHLCKQ